jgi:helix-turn-helix protein
MRQLGNDFGAELRRRRVAADLSLRDLAAKVHYSRGHLSKVENGQARASTELARLCDAVLQARGELIEFAVPNPVVRSWPSGYRGEVWTMGMDAETGSWFVPVGRRDLLASASSSMIGLSIQGPATISAAQAASIADTCRTWFDQARALGQRTSPGVLLPTLIAQTHTLRELAISAPSSYRSAMFTLAARFAEYTGWMAQEASDDRAALWWTHQAVELAAAGGDLVMGTYALVRRALVTFYANDFTQTIGLAKRAQANTRAPARVRGLAALREAQGQALAGTYDECLRSLDRARQHLLIAEHDPAVPVLGTSTVADPAAVVTGWCLHDLGHPKDAAAILDRELDRLSETARRARTRYAARRALAYATAGEVDHACALTHQLLPDVHDVGSATIGHDLGRLARTFRRWPTHPPVRQLQPFLNDALRSLRGSPGR